MKYFRYVIKNLEPLRISDDSFSQSGQTTTLRYIPGTTIRGLVINQHAGDPDFETYKKTLFSNKVRFLNAYLMVEEKELLPSVKGFYEEKKAEGPIENVLATGEVKEGMKRAGLGRYCSLEKDTVFYYNIETGSDMKIKIGITDNQDSENDNQKEEDKKQKVFRNEYMVPGYTFVGYIAVEDDSVEKVIAETFDTETMIIGKQRSQALGKCQILEADFVDADAYTYKSYLPKTDVKEICYMMLLSNTAMRGEDGEYQGLNLKTLEEKLGVTGLEIDLCATSVVQVRGYNRTWGSKIPSVPMYEAGSVFKLKFEGTLTKEAMEAVVDQGIGLRKNEGFGRVLFLNDYEKLTTKAEKEVVRNLLVSNTKQNKKKETATDKQVLKIAATNYYRNLLEKAMQDKIVAGTEKIGYMNGSQIGNVRAILFANRYNSKEAFKVLEKYFNHLIEKEQGQNIQKQRKSKIQFVNYIESIIGQEYPSLLGLENKKTIMGFKTKDLFTEEEMNRMKIEFLLQVIRFNNRKGEN